MVARARPVVRFEEPSRSPISFDMPIIDIISSQCSSVRGPALLKIEKNETIELDHGLEQHEMMI